MAPSRRPGPGPDIQARLRDALTDALRSRDRVAVAALRSALSAIANAEAISPPPPTAGAGSSYVAGGVAGLGAAEASRHRLTTADVEQIVQAELSERLQAAQEFDRTGHPARAERLRAEADVLRSAASGEARPGRNSG